MTPAHHITPAAILRADQLTQTHPETRHSPGIYVWSLAIGDRTFRRLNGSFATRDKSGRSRVVWCRIEHNKSSRSTKPSPTAFLAALESAIRNSQSPLP